VGVVSVRNVSLKHAATTPSLLVFKKTCFSVFFFNSCYCPGNGSVASLSPKVDTDHNLSFAFLPEDIIMKQYDPQDGGKIFLQNVSNTVYFHVVSPAKNRINYSITVPFFRSFFS
jgi:hypothetical protein